MPDLPQDEVVLHPSRRYMPRRAQHMAFFRSGDRYGCRVTLAQSGESLGEHVYDWDDGQVGIVVLGAHAATAVEALREPPGRPLEVFILLEQMHLYVSRFGSDFHLRLYARTNPQGQIPGQYAMYALRSDREETFAFLAGLRDLFQG